MRGTSGGGRCYLQNPRHGPSGNHSGTFKEYLMEYELRGGMVQARQPQFRYGPGHISAENECFKPPEPRPSGMKWRTSDGPAVTL